MGFFFIREEPIEEEPENTGVNEEEKTSAEKDQEIQKNVNGISPEANSPPSQRMEEKMEVHKSELVPSESLHSEKPNDRKNEETGPSSPLLSPDRVSKDQRNSG